MLDIENEDLFNSDDDDYDWLADRLDPDEPVDKKNSRCKKQIVAAIDFGTTYSGYAYSFSHEWTKVITPIYHGGEYLTHKAPTTLLLDPDQEFCKFGFDAEKEYSRLAEDDEHRGHYFFRRFKLILKPELTERMNRETVCVDETGKECNALKIFTYCIEHLKDSLLTDLNKAIKGEITMKDIDFVITIPAIWDDTAKMFMVEASVKAGIQEAQLKILFESEAASVYCQYMHLESDRDHTKEETFDKKLKQGFKYLVIDLGGGTADFSVHERAADKSLKQLIEPSGIEAGGCRVDDAYWQFFCDLLGEENMKRFKEESMEDYLDFFRKFEVQKRSGRTLGSDYLYIRIPMALTEIVDESGGVKKAISSSIYKDIISFDDKSFKCKTPFKEFERLFKETSDSIRSHIQYLFAKNELARVETVLLVGGFSECYIIQEMIKEEMEAKQMHLVLPNEPSLAVLKGAVYTGHVPDAVTTRISHYSYGIQNWPSFDPQKHPAEKKIMVDNQERCRDVFVKFLDKGEKITSGKHRTFVLEVLKPEEEKLDCSVYMSHKENPHFIDEDGVFKAGTLAVELPKVKEGTTIDIEIEVTILDMGIRIAATELETFKEFEKKFDLLSIHI